MSKQTYNVYNCDNCKEEGIERKEGDLKNWVVFCCLGARPFSKDNPLMINYLVDNYQCDGKRKISENLYFCCEDCVIEYILKFLGSDKKSKKKSEDVSAPKVLVEENRFAHLDTSGVEDGNDTMV